MRTLRTTAAAVGLFLLVLAIGAFAPLPAVAQTFSVSPASGQGTLTPVATWSVPGAASCTASGGWSGTKAASGTETLAAITKSATYGLTCATATGSTVVTWTAPTMRTDGSALTNLAGFKIYHGTSPTALTTLVTVNDAASRGTTITGLAPGLRYFAASAFDSAGVESLRTGNVSTTIVAGSISLPSVTVSVQSLPSPPTGLAVAPVVAGLNMNPVYRINADGSRGTAVLGFVPVGTPCSGPVVYTYRTKPYHRVDPAAVKWERTTPTTNAAAACAASSG